MKQHTLRIFTTRIAIAAAVAGGLSCINSARAQFVTGDPTLDNITPTAAYPSWSSALITDGSAGVEVKGLASYGSAYFAVPGSELQTLNTADNQATLTMTINNAVSPPGTPAGSGGQYWVGVPFILNDNAGPITYGGYTGEFGTAPTASALTATWNGNTVTETVPLDPSQIAAISAGGDSIYGFNLEFDPAVFPTGFEDITFDSLSLSAASAPDGTSTMMLLGSSAAVLAYIRRRK